MRLIYSLVLVFLFSSGLIAQKSLTIETVNIEELYQTVKNDLDVFRDTNRLTSLVEDQILYLAAEMQGEYNAKNNTVSHFQKSEKLKTVGLRVKSLKGFHGNVYEIATKIEIRKVKAEHHQALSRLMFKNILKSKKYEKILRSKGEKSLGMYLKKQNGSIWLVMVLGTPPIFEEKYTTPKKLYGIKSIEQDKTGSCMSCLQFIKQRSSDLVFDLTIINDTIYFVVSNTEWLHRLFVNKLDGFSVDIIRKAQYACGSPNVLSQGELNNGYLLPPIYTKEILAKARVYTNDYVFVPAGQIPREWKGEDYEMNLLLLQNNTLCRYNTFFQIPFGDSEPLDLPFDLKVQEGNMTFENVIFKEMYFEIPFEQGKSSFNSKDLKPLIDSLRLASYTITKLDILAYSSIEGSKEKNLELQQKRANSIVDVIQQYQENKVPTAIQTAENWSSFFEDIKSTSKAFLIHKTEDEIRTYVNQKSDEEIEEVLKNHRKAILKVSLERKSSIKSLTEKSLQNLYLDSSFQSSEDKYFLIEEVYQTGSSSLLAHLQRLVKDDARWSVEAKAKISVYQYLLDKNTLDKTLREISGFLAEKPQSSMLTYNYYALKLLSWEADLMGVQPQLLKKQIWSSKLISKEMLLRLRLNYDMLEGMYHANRRNNILRDRAIVDAVEVAKTLDLDDEEIFKVSKFLANNAKYQEALSLLTPRVNEINVHEDLLFLYINLTIIRDEIVKRPEYRTTLSNASVVNKERFCTIFKSALNGGITFQLLTDKYLKRSYCDICE